MIKTWGLFSKQFLLLAVGSVLCAASVKGLIMPHGFLSRGMTGLALVIYYQWPVLPVALLYVLINIPIFALGLYFVGRRFVLFSILGMVIYSSALYLMSWELPLSDPLLAALVAGGLSGTGSALILRSFGSVGGSDILCVIMNKFLSISLGTGAILINGCIMLLSVLVYPVEIIFYTLVFVFVSALFTDKVFHGMSKRRMAIIISAKWEKVAKALTQHRIGVTMLNGRGGYSGGEWKLLYSVVPAYSVPLLKQVVTEIDDEGFIAIMDAEDVTDPDVGNQPHW